MSWLRFASLNLIGALLWAPIVAGAGYVLGNAVEPLLEDGRYDEYFMFATVIYSAPCSGSFGVGASPRSAPERS